MVAATKTFADLHEHIQACLIALEQDLLNRFEVVVGQGVEVQEETPDGERLPEGSAAWMVCLGKELETFAVASAKTLDGGRVVKGSEFGKEAREAIRLEGGDCSTDSFCYPSA